MRPVNSVIILGAGSAGWLTALVLSTYCPALNISLVRPGSGAPIGVGESTQADFMQLLKAARLDMGRFFQACDVTPKCGIYYRDWNATGTEYWHPFSNLAFAGSYTPAHYYQQMIARGTPRFAFDDYYASVHTSFDTCIRRNLVAPESAAAFHLDATKITAFLEQSLPNVTVIDSERVEAHSDDSGITGLALDGGRSVTADLYVDCTGFSRALHGKVATPDIIPYEANVNRVVAAQIPFVDPQQETTPYTRAHAHEHGWTWSIPLRTRIGSGYVYHGDFCSQEQAEANFRRYWGEERMREVNVRHLAFDSINLKNPWVKNVVTIGLSAGFVEPLEATGLNWIITSANVLSQAIRVRYYDDDTSMKYNLNMLGYMHDVLDFIDVHYLLSNRRDSDFWRYQASREMPERLQLRLALYREEMPSDANRLKTSPWAFNEISWLDILNGYHFAYDQLDIHPSQEAMARRTLDQIHQTRPEGLNPLEFMPG